MDHDFWHRKWETNEIGFHEAGTHPMLLRHWHGFGLGAGSRIFVPLCGKSNDMLWLHDRGLDITGIELSEIAVAAFFADNGMEPERSEQGPFIAYRAPGYTLLCGDYFELTREVLGSVDAVYDRAALIALPAEERRRYISHLAGLLTPGTPVLLVALRYGPGLVSPPPYTVDDAEVESLWAPAFSITRLGTAPARVKDKPCEEAAYRMTLETDGG